MPGPRRRPQLLVLAPVACLTALVVWLTLELGSGGLDRGDKLASVVSMYTAIGALVLSAAALWRQAKTAVPHAPAPAEPGPERLDELAGRLADAVRAQWKGELGVHGVTARRSLPVGWTTVDGASLDGRGDEIGGVFARVESRRLVVLGPPGAGKSVLCWRLALDLLDAGGPVPLVLSARSWNARAQDLGQWVAAELAAHPVLAADDPSAATALVRAGLILPVLDGFDEISRDLRADAVARLNELYDGGLVLTSRPREYAEAPVGVERAAVIALDGLSATDIAAYLPALAGWDRVLSGDGPEREAVAAALGRPLMVGLADTVYAGNHADPAELLTVAAGAGDPGEARRRVENRLLDAFIPAAYASHRDPKWSPEEVRRWLAGLAVKMGRTATADMRWWRLAAVIPRWVHGLAVACTVIASGLLVAAVGAAAGDWSGGERVWFWSMATLSLAAGTCTGVVTALGQALDPVPARQRIRLGGHLWRVPDFRRENLLSWRPYLWIGTWVATGTVGGIVGLASGGEQSMIGAGVFGGLFLGAAVWATACLVHGLNVPVEPTEAASPVALLRVDRRAVLGQGLLAGLAGAVVIGPVVWLEFDVLYGLASIDLGLLAVLTLVALPCVVVAWALVFSAWGPWRVAHTWAALRGDMPWRAMAFFTDAHARGVLRQAGGVYQFRHARLQERLAETYR